ncbi:MAG: hypothetical protein Kow0029_28740 [Candidatus Rifleibacteriota bacterium]
MRKIFFLFVAMAFSLLPILAAEQADYKDTERVPVIVAQGFGFQAKSYKVIKLVLTEQQSKDEKAVDKSTTDLQGICEIAGYGFKLKPVLNGDDVLEADLMELPDPVANLEGKNPGKILEVPIGHLSIKASNPDPKNRVFKGTLRIDSEKAEDLNGILDVYLNDNTPPIKQRK